CGEVPGFFSLPWFQTSAGNGPGPSGLKRKPTRVRLSLLKVTRVVDTPAGLGCARAGTGSHDATTTSNASVQGRTAFTPRSAYRFHARRHNRPSSWLRSWNAFVEVQ